MVREQIVLGKGTDYPLKGILTLPESAEPVPAVVFVHGSGSSNMDEKVGKLTPFRDLAEGLAKHGIASLRYDKRSFAHGRKLMKSGTVITVKEETVEDAVLAAALLRKDSRIDPDRIFIVGHSMGAMLAPRIDAEGGDFRGLILMAGTLRSLTEILREQTADMMKEMKGLTRWIVQKQTEKFQKKLDGASSLSDEEAKRQKYGGGVTLYYFKEMDAHPAADYLRATAKPILVMQGEKDFQVKAETDFAGYQKLLGDRGNVRFRLYAGLNHCFVPSVYGSIAKAKQEYNKEQHIGEEVISDIAAFIHENR